MKTVFKLECPIWYMYIGKVMLNKLEIGRRES